MTVHDKRNLNKISQVIYDKKGFNILVLDVRGISSMTDFYVIAEGSVKRHVIAICSAIKKGLSELGIPLLHFEGDKEGDWVVMDCGGIVIHLFTPELREKYAVETLWRIAKIVDVDIILTDPPKNKMRELQ